MGTQPDGNRRRPAFAASSLVQIVETHPLFVCGVAPIGRLLGADWSRRLTCARFTLTRGRTRNTRSRRVAGCEAPRITWANRLCAAWRREKCVGIHFQLQQLLHSFSLRTVFHFQEGVISRPVSSRMLKTRGVKGALGGRSSRTIYGMSVDGNSTTPQGCQTCSTAYYS